MDDMELVSSRQAASLLGVHESSVKRWCNSDELACSYTAGGHRRIDLDDVLDFARRGGMECSLLKFGKDASLVWNGANELRLGRSAEVLVLKMREWLLHAEANKLTALLHLCHSLSIPYARLFDQLIGRVMQEIGDSWARGAFEIGDEHRISESLLDVLYGLLAEIGREQTDAVSGVAIVGCGPNESHATGAMMVRVLLSARGWKVIYLGQNVPVEDLLLYQRRHQATLVAVSMSSHREPAEIRQFVRDVTSLEREDVPFDLAIGGSGAQFARQTFGLERAWVFNNAEDFDDWLEVRYGK
jgi:excisionase family DNA binding protein